MQKTLGGGGFPASEDADLERSSLDENGVGRPQLACDPSTLWASVDSGPPEFYRAG